jgi:hypothetical protein
MDVKVTEEHRQYAYFLLDRKGEWRDILKARLKELKERQRKVIRWLKDIDPEASYMFDMDHGVVLGFNFGDRRIPMQFRRPVNGMSVPKKGTEYDKLFKSQIPMRTSEDVICEKLRIHGCVDYSVNPGGDAENMVVLGLPTYFAGFMFLGSDGPSCLWIMDITKFVADAKAQGFYVRGTEDTFQLSDIEALGAKQITQAEWELIAAKEKVRQERKKKD